MIFFYARTSAYCFNHRLFLLDKHSQTILYLTLICKGEFFKWSDAFEFLTNCQKIAS